LRGGSGSQCDDEWFGLEYDSGVFVRRHADNNNGAVYLHLGGSVTERLGDENGMQLRCRYQSGQSDNLLGGSGSQCDDEWFGLEYDSGVFVRRHADNNNGAVYLHLGGSITECLGDEKGVQLRINHDTGQSNDLYGSSGSQCNDEWFGLEYECGLLV
jgi:Fe-S cluster biogenesis protein NfuA